jgi:hypothetical protein
VSATRAPVTGSRGGTGSWRGTGSRAGLILRLVLPALMLACPAGAGAGTYDVLSCHRSGAPQNAFAPSADARMAAYNQCPHSPSNPASGLVTRASAGAGSAAVPYFAGAYQVFEAPPGASLVSVAFDVAAIRLASHWTTGIVAFDSDFNRGDLPYGCYAGSAGCAIGTASFFGPVSVPLYGHTRFRFETRCGNPGGCDISASGFQLGMRALFSAANITVRVQDFSPPAVNPWGGSLFGGGWLRGSQLGYSSEADNVGVMINRTWIDDQLLYAEDFRDPGWPVGVRCDFSQRRPCNDIPGAGSPVNTRALTDGAHTVRVEAVDAAGNAAGVSRRILVDNTAPARVSPTVDGGQGWRQANDFTIRWRPPPNQAAPVAKAHYRLCAAGSPARCTTGSQSGTGIEGLSALRVPESGEYTLHTWLEDEAGNEDSGNASEPVHLRFDDVAPERVAFELLDETDPRKIEVAVADSASGVAGGSIELRRSGWRQWHELRTALSGNRLSATVDDAALEDGVYELRARVADRAGNVRIGDRREDGAKMDLRLPLRSASRLTVGRTSARARCRRPVRRACRRRPLRRLRLAAPAIRLRGRLETSKGQALAGSSVDVLEQPRTGGGFRRVGSVRSDRTGRFGYRVLRGPSRTIRFSYPGTSLTKPAVGTVAVLVPARTTIAASRRLVRNGDEVVFRGRLIGRPIPEGGKLIDLQAFYRGAWRTFATPRSGAGGAWRYRYRFGATPTRFTYRFRARIRRESAYPYELGRSRVVRVTVLGR